MTTHQHGSKTELPVWKRQEIIEQLVLCFIDLHIGKNQALFVSKCRKAIALDCSGVMEGGEVPLWLGKANHT